jgi:hypothetical protein
VGQDVLVFGGQTGAVGVEDRVVRDDGAQAAGEVAAGGEAGEGGFSTSAARAGLACRSASATPASPQTPRIQARRPVVASTSSSARKDRSSKSGRQSSATVGRATARTKAYVPAWNAGDAATDTSSCRAGVGRDA